MAYRVDQIFVIHDSGIDLDQAGGRQGKQMSAQATRFEYHSQAGFSRRQVFFLPARITGNFTSIQSARASTFSPTSSPSGVSLYSTCGGTTG